jgi:hypothetical protein
MSGRLVIAAAIAALAAGGCGAPETSAERAAYAKDIVDDCIDEVTPDGTAIAGVPREIYKPCIDDRMEEAVSSGDLPRSYLRTGELWESNGDWDSDASR